MLLAAVLLAGCMPAEKQAHELREKWERATAPRADKSADPGPPPTQPKPYVTEEQALEAGRGVDGPAPWKAYLREEQFNVAIRGVQVKVPVWIVEATDGEGRTTVLYLDAVTGKELTRLQVAGVRGALPEVATPEAAVKSYFELTAAGKYEEAWPLLHPVAQKPNPPTPLGYILAQFFSREGQTGTKLKQVVSVTPYGPDGWKDPMCMCRLHPAAEVVTVMDDGTQGKVRVAQDGFKNWRILWHPQE